MMHRKEGGTPKSILSGFRGNLTAAMLGSERRLKQRILKALTVWYPPWQLEKWVSYIAVLAILLRVERKKRFRSGLAAQGYEIAPNLPRRTPSICRAHETVPFCYISFSHQLAERLISVVAYAYTSTNLDFNATFLAVILSYL